MGMIDIEDFNPTEEVAEEVVETDVEEVAEEALEEEQEEVEQEEQEEPKSRALSYEEYLEKGGDPDMYRGPKAFDQYYEKEQEVKQSRRELREIRESIDEMMSTMSMQQQNELAKQAMEFDKRLAAARETLDVEEVEKTLKEKADFEKQNIAKAPAVKQNREPAFIEEFRARNPKIDHNSSEFDADINLLVETKFNSQISKYDRSKLTQADYQDILDKSYESVASKFAPANKKEPRKPPQTARRAKKGVETAQSKIGALSSSARGIYESIKASNPKAAETYLNNITKKV